MIRLTHEPIETTLLLADVQSNQAGAVVLFLGTVRELTGDRRTDSLDYECYPRMAEQKLTEIVEQARSRWPIVECRVVHRLGHLDLGEIAVAVAVSTPHRQAAFESAAWIMDTIKQVVPIWKQERWADGSTEWVHPGLAPEESPK